MEQQQPQHPATTTTIRPANSAPPPPPAALVRPLLRDGRNGGTSLIDVLDRVLDKGLVIAGDVVVSLLDIELLTIKLRLLIASVDKAKEMGIDWWQHDPQLSQAARRKKEFPDEEGWTARLEEENRTLRQRLERLEAKLNALPAGPATSGSKRPAPRRAAAARSVGSGG